MWIGSLPTAWAFAPCWKLLPAKLLGLRTTSLGGKLPSTKQHAPIKPTDGSGYWISSIASFDNFWRDWEPYEHVSHVSMAKGYSIKLVRALPWQELTETEMCFNHWQQSSEATDTNSGLAPACPPMQEKSETPSLKFWKFQTKFANLRSAHKTPGLTKKIWESPSLVH